MKINLKKILEKIDLIIRIVEREIFLLFGETKNMIKRVKAYKKRSGARKFFRNLFFIALALFFFFSGAGLLWFSSLEIPDLASFDKRILGQSTKIYDKTGKVLLYDLSQSMRRTVLPFEKISPRIKQATIAIEDQDFYNHSGIKISSILRSFFADLFSFQLSQGGSTITQQVVKNSLLTKDKTITRKIKEVLLALKLEKNVSKDDILNLYLNESPYGGTIYGVEEASQSFFGKSASDVTVAEAAYIAALPKAPSHYSPYGKYKNELDNRKDLVLQKMKEQKYISEAEYNQAKAEKVKFLDQVSGGIKAPHFVMFIKQYLEENYGDQILLGGGLKVTTTLDYDLEQKAEEIVKKYALDNAKKYNATNSGLVAVDAKTGGILVMVGSRDYFDKEIDGNYNIATAERQPGSSFKPFVYAEAFNKGYRPETVLFDLPTQFSTNCSASDFGDSNNCYSPQDYDGKWRGPISLRNALAGSINIPAVKLLYLAGIQDSIDLAKKMGITTLKSADRYGLTLVLGGGEVTLLDMTSAYSVFANEGERHPSHGILKIEDKSGNILEEEKTDNTETVLPKDTALLITDILSDNTARTPVFGAKSSLYFPDRDVAVKTGTTNNYRDTWVIGYTPQVAVGAWDGNNDNSPIAKQVAGFIVAPMWHEFMNELLKTLPDERFEKPEQKDLSTLKPILRGEWNTGDAHSILYYVDKNDPLGNAPRNPWNDPQFVRWDYSIQAWLRNQAQTNAGSPTTPLYSTSTGQLLNAGGNPTINTPSSLSISIISPQNASTLPRNQSVTILVGINSTNIINKVDFYINGTYVGTNLNNPYSFTFIPSGISNIGNSNTLRAVVTDQKGTTREATINFLVN